MRNKMIHKFGLLVAMLFLLLLFVGGPGSDASRLIKHLWDLGHVFSFALWTWLYLQWRAQAEFWRQFLLLLVLTLLIGGVTELIQAQWLASTGREGSWLDLQKDLLGCVLVLLFLDPTRRKLKRGLRHALQLLVLLLTFWTLVPLAYIVADEVVSWRQFPLLSGFETSLEIERWEGNSYRQVVNEPVYRGIAALQVQLNTDQYSGVTLSHFPADWSEYQLLYLAVYNPDQEPLRLNLRIHDRLHQKFNNAYSDRFNIQILLEQGWTQIDIPLSEVAMAPKERRMDLSRIAGLQLFTVKLERPRTLFIDDVRLIRE